MNIRLDSRFSISSDKYQFILMLDDRPNKFFVKLEGLIEEYLNMKMRTSEARKLEHLKNYIENVKKQLCEVLQAYNISKLNNSEVKNGNM